MPKRLHPQNHSISPSLTTADSGKSIPSVPLSEIKLSNVKATPLSVIPAPLSASSTKLSVRISTPRFLVQSTSPTRPLFYCSFRFALTSELDLTVKLKDGFSPAVLRNLNFQLFKLDLEIPIVQAENIVSVFTLVIWVSLKLLLGIPLLYEV